MGTHVYKVGTQVHNMETHDCDVSIMFIIYNL